MPHEETIKERIERKLDRLERTISPCNSADAIDAAFYIGEDAAKLTDEQIERFETLNKIFWQQCECKKRENKLSMTK